MEKSAQFANKDVIDTENNLRQSMQKNQIMQQKQEEETQQYYEELEEKAARVDLLEKQMANLEMDKEEMKKKMMAEVKLDMVKEKRRLKGFLGVERLDDEDEGRA